MQTEEPAIESAHASSRGHPIGSRRDDRFEPPASLWTSEGFPRCGSWTPNGGTLISGWEAIGQRLREVARPAIIVETEAGPGVGDCGMAVVGEMAPSDPDALPMRAHVPPLLPSQLGDASFCRDYGLRYAYLTGAMANGIGSEAIVEAMGLAGMLGFFGSAGLPLDRVEQAIDRIQSSLGQRPYGFNLIHSPSEPALEAGVVDLYLRRGVRLVDASAYLDLTLPLIRYRFAGIHRDSDGRIVCPNRVIGKVSRVEVATKFFSPPPAKLLAALVESGDLTPEQSRLAERVPVAEDITAEADSGGHTDNRPAIALIPTMIALRDELQRKYEYDRPLRVGAAGGIATPASAAAAFAMGAAYIMTGSINQACVEAGTSQTVREMLAQASSADVAMAPAADMFEMGVQVQVLKWGTLFSVRAKKLYEMYRQYASLEEIPQAQRTQLERDYLRCGIDEAWEQTRQFFAVRDPRQITRAEAEPRHKMALVFRSYLGRSSDWANKGDASRKADYQIWCGPAMGAFNEWVKGSFLERPENRRVATLALNLIYGAAVQMRINWLRTQGVDVPPEVAMIRPVTPETMTALMDPHGTRYEVE